MYIVLPETKIHRDVILHMIRQDFKPWETQELNHAIRRFKAQWGDQRWFTREEYELATL